MFDDARIQYTAGIKTRQERINQLLECLQTHQAGLLMVEVKDTIKVAKEGKAVKTLPRETFMAGQSHKFDCWSAYANTKQEGFLATNDVSLIEHYAMNDVYVVQRDYRNIKVTTIEDIKEIN